ncbi:MAG: hypothetical protein PHU27_12225 [Salinivirgaceae bacterium]|nr:hypothetical protein [Salinivirgaceae bacterium]
MKTIITEVIGIDAVDIPTIENPMCYMYCYSAEMEENAIETLLNLWQNLFSTIPREVINRPHQLLLLKIILPATLRFKTEHLELLLESVKEEFGMVPVWSYSFWNLTKGRLELNCFSKDPVNVHTQ